MTESNTTSTAVHMVIVRQWGCHTATVVVLFLGVYGPFFTCQEMPPEFNCSKFDTATNLRLSCFFLWLSTNFKKLFKKKKKKSLSPFILPAVDVNFVRLVMERHCLSVP